MGFDPSNLHSLSCPSQSPSKKRRKGDIKMGAEGEPPSEKDTEEIRSRIKNYMRDNGQGNRLDCKLT